MRLRPSLSFAAVLLCWTVRAGAQTPGLTVGQAIERALSANPTIAAARLQRPVDIAGLAVARERPNPELGYEATNELPHHAFSGSVPIELGGKRQARINVANATVAAGEADLARIITEIRSDVRRAYFEVVAADQRIAFADQIRALATRARDAARARVQAGDVPQSDLTQASLALANSEIEATAARGDAASARAELNSLLGQPTGTTLTLADDLSSGTLMPLSDAVSLASRSNAEVIALDRRIDLQTAKVALANAMRKPDASAGGALTYDAETEFRFGWRLAGTITLPVFTSHRAAVQVEDAELARLKRERDAVMARMSGAIAAAAARAASAREQLTRYQDEVLPLAVEAERQAQVAYAAGQTGLVALVEALRTARETRQRGLQAAQDFQRALGDLERAMGIR